MGHYISVAFLCTQIQQLRIWQFFQQFLIEVVETDLGLSHTLACRILDISYSMWRTTRPDTVLHVTAPPLAPRMKPINRLMMSFSPGTVSQIELSHSVWTDYSPSLWILLWSICRDALCVHVLMHVCMCAPTSCALTNNWSRPRQRPSDLINFSRNCCFDASITVILTTSSFRHWFVTEALWGPSAWPFAWWPMYFLTSQLIFVPTRILCYGFSLYNSTRCLDTATPYSRCVMHCGFYILLL